MLVLPYYFLREGGDNPGADIISGFIIGKSDFLIYDPYKMDERGYGSYERIRPVMLITISYQKKLQ